MTLVGGRLGRATSTVSGGTGLNEVQQHVQDAIDRLVASGAERALQVAAYRHGDLVVDAVAGVADPATER